MFVPNRIIPQDDGITFDIEVEFPLQSKPYSDAKEQDGAITRIARSLTPEAHFRTAVEDAKDIKGQPLGFKIGKIKVVEPRAFKAA